MNPVLISLMNQVKSFLIEHSIESKITASRIFNANVKTLTAFINREHDVRKNNENQNKILSDQKETTVSNFIRSLLAHEISSTHQIVFGAIISLKRARNFTDDSSSIKR
jgi:hypothetical protein